MKLIALDVGTKRIGVAKADSKVRIAIPYSAVEVNGEEFKKIASLARAWDISNFVLGLPRSNEGVETKQSLYVRQFAKHLKRAIPNAKICFQDESLTSVEAEKRLKGRKKGYAKGDIDSEAAAIILQDFLEEKTGKSTSRAAVAKRRSVKGAKPRHRLAPVLIALLVLVGLAGGAAWWYYDYNLLPVLDWDCNQKPIESCEATTFAILTGSSVGQVADELKEKGLIRDSLVFQVHFRLSAGGEMIKAGEYEINRSMSIAELTDLFLKGGDNTYSFTTFPGDQVKNVREDLIEIGYSAEDVDAALAKDYRSESFGWIFEGRPDDNLSLEGYLWGDTYEFYRDDTVEAVITRILEEFADVLEENHFKERFAEHGFSLYEGITFASVVQREANTAEDMAKVAQVFYNRFNHGMTMGSDVTAIYAVDLADPNRETYADNAAILAIDSAYNTRLYGGLPYGPVSNPGIGALNAVAAPDESMTDTLFFLTGDDGMMYYSSTEEGHIQNITSHCQVLCNANL